MLTINSVPHTKAMTAPPQGRGAVCGGPPGGVRRLQDQTGEENPALHPELVHPPRDRGGHRQTLRV